MYPPTSFTSLQFGLFVASQQYDSSRLLNKVELLVEGVEENLALVGSKGTALLGQKRLQILAKQLRWYAKFLQ